jgi:3-hydroxyacyl-CoA dehydrogenase
MSEARYAVHGNVAVITLDNPPVNGLGHALRKGIVEGLAKANADASVAAIVITGGGNAFSGGADIKEFNTPAASAEPHLRQVIDAVEASPKPVVAAIHKVAMGGGLELALGCHYRVASPGAQLALPEVKLGILPGAGGTQRLPRAIDPQKALEMMITGNPVLSEKAPAGIVDQMMDGDLVQRAIAFAQKLAAEKKPLRKLRDEKVKLPVDAATFFGMARQQVAKESKGFPAPLRIVDCVEAAATRPFDEGMKVERDHFEWLVSSTESKALRHAFFGERVVAKIPDVPDSTPAREIRKAAVIGAGTMGGGIAMNFANAGIPVTVLETKQEALDKGIATILRNYTNTMKKGRLTQEQVDQRMALIKPTLEYKDLADADIVIEAVFEEMGVKQKVFEQLDAVMKPGAILASNTSTLDVDKIAAFTKRPQDVIGTHFFSPANVMRLLEVVRGKETSKEVLATTMKLAKTIKKVGVVSGVCDGFIGNRMMEHYIRQAMYLLDEGALPEQVDAALEKWGLAMGPFRVSDLAGLDVGWYIRKRRYAERPDFTYSKIGDRICEMGRFGQKTGAGFYKYDEQRKAHPDPEIRKLIEDYSKEIGVTRRHISDEEIVERTIFPLVTEGANILADGTALRAVDIDMVYLTGYGFPLYRGGPMFYADTVGLKNVVAAIERFQKGYQGKTWHLSPLLAKLAAEGKTFN